MTYPDTPATRRRSAAFATLMTIVLIGIGLAIREGLAESLLIGLVLVFAAVVVSAVSPAAGITSVLLATPTMYDLYPMPRGSFSLLEVAIVTVTAGIGLRLLVDAARKGWARLGDLMRPAQVVVPIGMLLAATALSLATLADPGHRAESLREVRTVIIEPLLFFAVARMAMRDEVTRRFAGWALVLAGTGVATYAIAQIALDLGGVAAGSVTRATATYTHPNNLALFLERTVLVTVGVGIVRPRWWPVWLLALVQFAGLALTFSRGALIALAVGVAVVLLLRGLVKSMLLLVAGGIGVAGVGVVLFPERFVDAGGSGAEPTRFTIWRASWRMVMDHPLFGVGPDQFLYQYSRRYIEPMGWPERYTSHPHNLVLDVWLRLGAMGLAAVATLAVGIMWWTRKWFHLVRNDSWSLGAIAALAGGIAHGMVDRGFFLPDIAVLTWFFFAVLITVPGRTAERQSPVEGTSTSSWPVVSNAEGRRQVGTQSAGSWSKGHAVYALLASFVVLPMMTDWPFLPFVLIAIVGLVTITSPPVGVAMVVLSVPVQEVATLPFVRNELTFTQVIFGGLVLGWLVTIRRRVLWLDAVVLGFVLVFAAFSMALVEMDEPGLWVGEVYRWAAAAAVFLVARSVFHSWSDIRPTIWAMAAGVAAVSVASFWQLVTRTGPDSFLVGGAIRVYGSFGTPNTLAAYLEFTVPLLLMLGVLLFRRHTQDLVGAPLLIAALASSAMGSAALLLTQSRGGTVGFIGALFLVALMIPRKVLLPLAVFGMLLIAGFAATPAGQSQTERFLRVFRSQDSAVEFEHQDAVGRGSLWGAAIRMIEDEPLTGIGAGEYDYHYREYVPEWVDRFPRGQAHNGWLQMGAQAGVPGIIAFSIWLAASLAALWGAARRSTDELARLLAWGGLAVMLAFSLHSLVDYLNVLSLGIQLSAITAIGLALAPDPLRSVQRRRYFNGAVSDTDGATVTAR